MANPNTLIPREPYETDFHKLGGGLTAPYRGIAGLVGNVLTTAGLTNPTVQARDLATREVASRQPRAPIAAPIATGRASNRGENFSSVSPRPIAAAPPSRAVTPRQASGPVDAPLHYENLGLGPNDLSRTSTGRIPSPVKPVGIADGEGTGYAVVGGKRISYRDIGTRQDPLASRRTDGIATAPDGQTVLLGNAAGYRPSRDVDWSPGSANERTTQLAAAERQGMAPDGQGGFRPLRQYERDAAGLTTKQDTIDSNNKAMQDETNSIAYNMRNDYDGFARIMQSKARIAALRGQNALLQQGIAGDQALAAHQYTADQNLRGHQYTADSLRATKDAENNAAQAESLRKQQEQERKSRQDDRKRRDAQVRSHLDRYDWGKISPTAANEYAGLLADTDGKGYVTLRDPSGTYGDVMVHQGVEQGLRSAYGKIRTADQFQAWLNQARKLGGNNAPVYQTSIKNSASLPLLRSKQVPLTQEDNVNG